MKSTTSRATMAILTVVVALSLLLAVGYAVEEDKVDASGQWIYILEDGHAKITGYTKESYGPLSFPSELDGYTVTGIGVGDSIFPEENSITSISIPNGITNIGDFAFAYSSCLTSINIPASVTNIGTNPFVGCPLISIDVAPKNSTYECIDGVLFNKQQKTLIFYQEGKEGAYSIPNGVLYIGDCAFLGCGGLTGISIPDSVISIGEGAFALCQNQSLTSISIPDSVTNIGEGAFNRCTYLTSINIPDGVTIIDARTFAGCFGLTSVSIPDSVMSIGDRAFQGCRKLTLSITRGSVAEQFAKDNDIAYVFIE